MFRHTFTSMLCIALIGCDDSSDDQPIQSTHKPVHTAIDKELNSNEKLGLLNKAYQRYENIRSALEIGITKDEIASVAGKPDQIERYPDDNLEAWKYIIHEGVYLDANFDAEGICIGYFSSGIEPMMIDLNIDFQGNTYNQDGSFISD